MVVRTKKPTVQKNGRLFEQREGIPHAEDSGFMTTIYLTINTLKP